MLNKYLHNKDRGMTYSITVKDADGNEKICEGDNVDNVHKEVRKLAFLSEKELALKTTKHIQVLLESKIKILSNSIKNRIDLWEHLIKNINAPFVETKPLFRNKPEKPEYFQIPPKPQQADQKYFINDTPFYSLFKDKYPQRATASQKLFENDLNEWEQMKISLDIKNQELKDNFNHEIENVNLEYESELKEWVLRKEQFEENQKKALETINTLKREYFNREKAAIETYNYELLKIASENRKFYSFECGIFYNPENKILAVEYLLPSSDSFSTVREVKYVATRDVYEERFLSKRDFISFYDESVYQLTLSVISEVFKHDEADAIDSIVLNGYVKTINKSTGENIQPYILSILVSKSEFNTINLERIDVKQCFKSLKGISASELANQNAIAPIIKIDKTDKRFVEGKDVVSGINESINIAAMDWEDFEHLVREIFEKEFSYNGGEVKVTRTSRDGGVDAIAFDPDPIRGGKIVIQAKRYTNTVGVASVRDLYGTLLNEGATKGILVTTSDYGSDAYEFAKGKPLTLLNGSNLLHLLEKHGHQAKIDLKEAKNILYDNKDSI
jgi:restriction system protein